MTLKSSLAEPDPLLAALRTHFGFDSFRPLQREAIEHVEGGGDALVLMPTGGGKSLCYQLPAVRSDGLTVVVSPLIALMKDQVDALRAAGANAVHLNSTLSPMDMAAVERDVLSGHVRLLYVSPERVNTNRFRRLLEQRPPDLIAIDEAHCISEWGHEFRPDYRVLRQLTDRYLDVPTVACTATATPQVQDDIKEQLDRPRMETFATGFGRDNLTIRIVQKKKAVQQLAARLHDAPGEAAIVYAQSRKGTEDIADNLREKGIVAEHYHAGMNGMAREAVQRRFIEGETSVICATVAFGMGIDKPDVRLVAHLDMPASIERYYQEIGRAGRDGLLSECLLFYTPGIWYQQQYFIQQIHDEDERKQSEKRLRKMMNFCEQSSCRWASILKYLGEHQPPATCDHCDICLGEPGVKASERGSREVDPVDPPEPPGSDGPRPLNAAEEALYEALRQERSRLAQSDAVPLYRVASNRQLAALAWAQPLDQSEMLDLKGFRAEKVAQYGDAFLNVISEQLQQPAQPSSDPARETEADSVDNEPHETWQQRFNALAEWRAMTAEQESCAPTDLLSYAAMRELAEHPPASIGELSRVEGVGTLAVERFADELSAILGISTDALPAVPTVPTAPTVPTVPTAPTVPTVLTASDEVSELHPSAQTTLDLYQDGHTLLAIAERRMLSPGTVASHLVTALRRGHVVNIERSLPTAELVADVRREIMRDPDATVSTLHERLEQRLSRPELTLVVAHLRPPELVD